MRGPFSNWGLDVRFFVLFSVIIYKGFGSEDEHKKTYVVRYKNGDSTIPVTVVLDYKKQAEYVINMNPRTPTKSVTFYDFKEKSIAYKDMTNRECFVSQLTHENLQEENEILETLKNPVEAAKPLILTLDPTRRSLTPTQIRNFAGQKVAMFCRKMATWRLQESLVQKRTRRQVVSTGEQRHGSNNQGTYPLHSQETHQLAAYNVHKKRKNKQARRKNRNILVPKASDTPVNIYYRQAFHQKSGDNNAQYVPESNPRKISSITIQQNPQTSHHTSEKLIHQQNPNTFQNSRFHNNIYPRSRTHFNNFDVEGSSGSLGSESSSPRQSHHSFNGYRSDVPETQRGFHSPVINDSSEEIFDQWSHPLRIPNRKSHIPHTDFNAHYNANINALPYDDFSEYIQPLHRTKSNLNNFENQWSLPLRYNSSGPEESPFSAYPEKFSSNKLNSRTEFSSVDQNQSLHAFIYDTLNDSVIEENKPSYQTLFHVTKTYDETTQSPEILLNFKETENGITSKVDSDAFKENINAQNFTPKDHSVVTDAKVTEDKRYKEQKERADTSTDADYVIIRHAHEHNDSNSDQSTFRHHTQFRLKNSTSDEDPKRQERLQNALKLFTPDEIIIDIGKYPTENQNTHTPIFNDHQSPTNRPIALQPSIRTAQHHQRPKQIARPQLRNSYQYPNKNGFNNQVSNRKIYTANHNVFPSVTKQQSQPIPAVLPPGFAIYPRHPKAPYASLASPDSQRTVLPIGFPSNGHSVRRQHHRQRHHHKIQNNLCCGRQNSSPRSGSCCASRGSCCTTHHRGQYLTTCCPKPKANDVRENPRSAPPVTNEERPPADQQYNTEGILGSKELCEKKKMCRTLYQSTQAVMLCRNGHVAGC